MKPWFAPFLALLVAGCAGTGSPAATAIPRSALLHLDAGTSGGLSDDLAAHPSVQLARPGAYALAPEAAPFLDALEGVVAPQRRRIAERLRADAAVTAGIAGWARAGEADRLALLRRVMAIACEEWACAAPTIVVKTRDPAEPALFAAYASRNQVGEVVLYMTPLAAGGAVLAISALLHEVRHAAQDQLAFRAQALPAATPEGVLARSYAAAFAVVGELGGEDDLAYGDYVHLNVEYDAFQSGNQIAAILSGGTAPIAQLGFVDVKFTAALAPAFDLRAAARTSSGAALITAVNAAHAQAQRTGAPARRGRERLRIGARG